LVNILQLLYYTPTIVTKADKGNSLIILPETDYNNKVHTFRANNNFTLFPHDTTKRLQRIVRTAINECKDTLPKETKWRHVSLNPTAPKIRDLIKIHKEDSPIRPVVNWKNTPAYKLARSLVKKLQTHVALPYAFNIKNTIQLINGLKNIPFNQNLRLALFDISNMYTNIPTEELLTITESTCKNNNVEEGLKCDILKLLNVVIYQNDFQFMDKTYVQHDGLAMGAPTSSILSEFYLQHLKNSKIYDILLNFNIMGYFQYVDDLLIITMRGKQI
jgi:hypothetical protein